MPPDTVEYTDAQLDEIEDALSQAFALQGDFRAFFKWCKVETEAGLVHAEDWDHFWDPQYSPQHISLSDAIEQGKDVTILKARQLGATTFMRARDIFDIQWKTIRPLQVFSRGEDESREYLKLLKQSYDSLPPDLKRPTASKPTKEELSILDGGRVYSFPATEDSGRSFSSHRAVFDENAFHNYAAKNYAAVEAQATQMVHVSTANGDNFFSQRFWNCWNGDGAPDEVAIFYPWWVRPDRQNADGTANWDWYRDKKAKYPGFEEDFLAEYPSNPLEAFLARSGLVYAAEWSPERNVLGYDPFEWETSLRVAGVDFGGGDPTAAVTLGRAPSGAIHQFDEFYDTTGTATIPDLVAWLAERRVQYVFCDPSSAISIQTLRAAGINALGRTTTQKALNDRAYGLTTVGTLLSTGQLTIGGSCSHSIDEFSGYRWRRRRDPNTRQDYATSTPVDHHADAMDARRYAIVGLMGLVGEITAAATMGTLDGRKRVAKAV